MTGEATLSVPATWTETRFERGVHGPDDREGFEATLEAPGATLEVTAVRYAREDGAETVRAVGEDWEAGRRGPGVPPGAVEPTTAFATRLTYTPLSTEREEVPCVAADAGDALAVAVWLADAAEDAADLRRHVGAHAGSGSPTGAAVADDEVLAAAFADDPDRCVFTARETRSHRIELPYRYAPLLSAVRRTRAGVVRFPSTVRTLAGAVSHQAWEEHGLDGLGFGDPLERESAGEYRLATEVADAVAGADAEAFALRRLGE